MARESQGLFHIVDGVSYLNRAEYRKQLISLALLEEPQLEMTFAINRPMPISKAEDLIKDFLHAIDRRLMGRARMSARNSRTWLFGVFENVNTNIHCQAIGNPPRDLDGTFVDPGYFSENARAIWKTISKSGDLHVSPIRDEEKLTRYITKQLHWEGVAEHFVLSSLFHPAPR